MGLFDDADRLVDCAYQRQNVSLVAVVFHDAIVKQTSGQMIQMTDVRLVTRACKRFIRKVLRWTPGEPDPGNFKEAKLRQSLHKGIPGTSMCSLRGHQLKTGNDVVDPSTDKCCKQLHSCSVSIPGWTFQYEHFNIHPWPLPHCNCSEAFYSCLRDSKGPLSKEVANLYFNVIKLRCFKERDEDICTHWDEWYTKCKNFTRTISASVMENARF
ncbi:phospholipase A2 isozymes PA3A/PA3B/PA5-like [Liolophura sinensis]|uniref:phospholipase A2 isozymes PA3A/PA3B/PA5-like n=1 Tax=Liolophura sinensis TaxID=3198878 RepID=UPI0031589081